MALDPSVVGNYTFYKYQDYTPLFKDLNGDVFKMTSATGTTWYCPTTLTTEQINFITDMSGESFLVPGPTPNNPCTLSRDGLSVTHDVTSFTNSGTTYLEAAIFSLRTHTGSGYLARYYDTYGIYYGETAGRQYIPYDTYLANPVFEFTLVTSLSQIPWGGRSGSCYGSYWRVGGTNASYETGIAEYFNSSLTYSYFINSGGSLYTLKPAYTTSDGSPTNLTVFPALDPNGFLNSSFTIGALCAIYNYASGGTFQQVLDYDKTYSIKSFTGDKTFAVSDMFSSVEQEILTSDGLNRTLTLINANNEQCILKWTSTKIKGYAFIGLSLSANSKTAYIKPGQTCDFLITANTTWYEVWSPIVPETWSPSTDITLYNNTADATRVDKSDYLSTYMTLEGTFRESQDVLHPSVLVALDQRPTANYAYISDFGRHYFIDKVTSITQGVWQLDMSVDVLMTFSSAIKSCTGFIDRNENDYNAFIVDNQIPLKQGETITTTFIDNDVLANQNYTFIMQGILLQPESSSSQSSTDENIAVTDDTGDDTANDETHEDTESGDG